MYARKALCSPPLTFLEGFCMIFPAQTSCVSGVQSKNKGWINIWFIICNPCHALLVLAIHIAFAKIMKSSLWNQKLHAKGKSWICISLLSVSSILKYILCKTSIVNKLCLKYCIKMCTICKLQLKLNIQKSLKCFQHSNLYSCVNWILVAC